MKTTFYWGSARVSRAVVGVAPNTFRAQSTKRNSTKLVGVTPTRAAGTAALPILK